jgi:hypothetical protein
MICAQGDGTASVSSYAISAVFVDEIDPNTGTVRQTLPLPTGCPTCCCKLTRL